MGKNQPKQKLISRAISAAITLAACGGMNAYAQKAALEEVVVTAQKRGDETLQSVPMNVNAVTAEAIAKYNLLDFKDITQVSPGLTIEPVNARIANVSLRGIQVNSDAAAGVAVAIYWNEVEYDIDSAFKAMYDVQQVEVLHGPQGTLRGITAPAGAITIRTATPSYDKIDGYVQQSFSDQDLSNTQFGVSLPIVENMLAVRLAGLYDHTDGGGLTNVVTGTHESAETRSGRLTVGFRPVETVETNFIYQHLEDIADDLGSNLAGSGDSGTFGRFDRRAASDMDGIAHSRRDIATLNVTWDLDGHQLNYIGGYQRRRLHNISDLDMGNVLGGQANFLPAISAPQEVTSHTRLWGHELRFSSVGNDFYNYTYGLYYSNLHDSTPVHQKTFIGFYDFGPLFGDTDVLIGTVSEGHAVFTNQSFKLTEATEVQVGLRYQEQRMSVDGFVSTFTPPSSIVSPDPTHFISTDEALSGSASISHQLTDELRLYANYGHSFRPSGSDPLPTATPLRAGTWSPETSNAIELGFKSRWNDGRLQLNGDVFYQKFHNFIARAGSITTNNDLQGKVETSYGFNYSADVIVQGAEISLDALLTDEWQAGLSVSYTDAKYNGAPTPCNKFAPDGKPVLPTEATAAQYGVSLGPTGEYFVCGKNNGRLGTEPNWMVSATTEYTWPMGEFEPFVRALYNFHSMRANDVVQDGGETPAYGIVNLFVGVRGNHNAWEVSLWAKNLFDHQAYTEVSDPIIGAGFASQEGFSPVVPTGYTAYKIIPEREIGVTGKYSF